MRRGNKWVKWIWLAVVIYMMFTVGRLAYRNYQLNVQELKLRTDVTNLESDIQTLKYQIVYFQSDSYKEKMLREKLNLQKPDEKVVAIAPEPKVQAPENRTTKNNVSNPQAWLEYFIGI